LDARHGAVPGVKSLEVRSRAGWVEKPATLDHSMKELDGSLGGGEDDHPAGGVQLFGYLFQVGAVSPDHDGLGREAGGGFDDLGLRVRGVVLQDIGKIHVAGIADVDGFSDGAGEAVKSGMKMPLWQMVEMGEWVLSKGID